MARDDVARVLDVVRKGLGKDLAATLQRLGDTEIQPVDVVSTGSMALDHALGVGGFPLGRIVEVYGPESSGKTTLALHAMAEAQKRGLVCGFVDAEHALDVGYAKALGVVTDDLLLSQPDNGEQGLDMVERLIEAGAGVVVVDSVAALVPKAEIDGDMGDAHMGLQARLMSQAMRKLTGVTFKSNALVIFINQIRMKIGVLYGSPETTSGGNALKFYASVRIDVRRIGKVGEDKVTTGVHTRAKVVKNKLAPPFREAEFDITFGKGIDRDLDLLVVAEALEVVDKAGSWYSFAGEKLAQGREAVGAVLAGNPELRAKLEAAVRERVRKKPTAAA